MAKKRRSYQINSGDYNVAGGGGGTSSGNVRYMQKSTTAVAAGGTGVLYTPGTKQVPNPLKFNCEAGLGFSSANSVDSRVYFEHAFESPSAQVALVGSNQTDELPTGYSGDVPAGMTFSNNQDQGDGNYGYVQITTNSINIGATAGIYKFRHSVDQGGWSRSYIDYEINVWPQNTTPDFNSSGFLFSRVIRNQAAKQYVTDTVTAPQATSYALANVSGVPTGYTLKIEPLSAGANAGRAYFENTPNTEHPSATLSFDIVIDLGEYGLYTESFTGSMVYGDPYGSRYWGPANAYRNYTGGDYRTASDPTQVNGDYWHAVNINQGALNYITDANRSSTPYTSNYNGVVTYTDNTSNSANNINSTSSLMATNYVNNFVTGNSGRSNIYRWTVPNGVTEFSVVAIGPGCGGTYNWSGDGGGGGGLAWCNNVTCTPGETFTVAIGIPHYRIPNQNQYASGDSFLLRDTNNEYIVIGYGGGHYSGRSAPYGWIGSSRSNSNSTPSNPSTLTHSSNPQFNHQGDAGSASASTAYGTRGAYYGGSSNSYGYGGACAGYRGTGSNGSNGGSSNHGGGRNGRNYSSTWGGSGGGGTGADGNGRGVSDFGYSYGSADEQSDTNSYSNIGSHGYRYGGGGGSGGTRGDWGENPYTGRGHYENTNYAASGGCHGGGGGGSGSNGSPGGGRGGPGCVRIIWGKVSGTKREFPNQYTTERIEINNQN